MLLEAPVFIPYIVEVLAKFTMNVILSEAKDHKSLILPRFFASLRMTLIEIPEFCKSLLRNKCIFVEKCNGFLTNHPALRVRCSE